MKTFIMFIRCWLQFPKVYREIRKNCDSSCTFWQVFSCAIAMCKIGWLITKYLTPQQFEELRAEWSKEDESNINQQKGS